MLPRKERNSMSNFQKVVLVFCAIAAVVSVVMMIQWLNQNNPTATEVPVTTVASVPIQTTPVQTITFDYRYNEKGGTYYIQFFYTGDATHLNSSYPADGGTFRRWFTINSDGKAVEHNNPIIFEPSPTGSYTFSYEENDTGWTFPLAH